MILKHDRAPSILQVVPIQDLIEHEPFDCVCGPRDEPVKHDDGSMGWIFVHHALDGRA